MPVILAKILANPKLLGLVGALLLVLGLSTALAVTTSRLHTAQARYKLSQNQLGTSNQSIKDLQAAIAQTNATVAAQHTQLLAAQAATAAALAASQKETAVAAAAAAKLRASAGAKYAAGAPCTISSTLRGTSL